MSYGGISQTCPQEPKEAAFTVGLHSILHSPHLPLIDFFLQLLVDSFQNHYNGISQSISPLCMFLSSPPLPESTQTFLLRFIL